MKKKSTIKSSGLRQILKGSHEEDDDYNPQGSQGVIFKTTEQKKMRRRDRQSSKNGSKGIVEDVNQWDVKSSDNESHTNTFYKHNHI